MDGSVNERLDLGRLLPAVAIIALWIWLGRRTFRRMSLRPLVMWLVVWAGLVTAGVLLWKLTHT
jgi:uncharacterized membrane protein YfcA